MGKKVIYSILGAIITIIVVLLIIYFGLEIQAQQSISNGMDGDSASWGVLIGMVLLGLPVSIIGGIIGAICGYKIGKGADKRKEEQKPTDQL